VTSRATVLGVAAAVVAAGVLLVVIGGGAYVLLTRARAPQYQAGPVPPPPVPTAPAPEAPTGPAPAPSAPSPPPAPPRTQAPPPPPPSAPPAQPAPPAPGPPPTAPPGPPTAPPSPGPAPRTQADVLPLAVFREPRGLFVIRYPDGWQVNQGQHGQFSITVFYADDPERLAFTVQLAPVDSAPTAQEAQSWLLQQAARVYPDFRSEGGEVVGGPPDPRQSGIGARWTNRRGERVRAVILTRTFPMAPRGTVVVYLYFQTPEASFRPLVPTFNAMLMSFNLTMR